MNIELQITLWITAGWLLCGFIAYGVLVNEFLCIWEDGNGNLDDFGRKIMASERIWCMWVSLFGIIALLVALLSREAKGWRL